MYRKSSERMPARIRQRGIGLPATIFVITVLALIVVALADLTQDSNIGFAQNFQSQRAFYAAESGAQVALNRVFVGSVACNASLVDIDFNASGTNPGLENCTVALSCSQVSVAGTDYFTISSQAVCGSGMEQATRSIEVRSHE